METTTFYSQEYRFECNEKLPSIKEGLEKSTSRKWYDGQKAYTAKFVQSVINDATEGIETIRIYEDCTATFQLSYSKIPEHIWEESVVKNIISHLTSLGAKDFQRIA